MKKYILQFTLSALSLSSMGVLNSVGAYEIVCPDIYNPLAIAPESSLITAELGQAFFEADDFFKNLKASEDMYNKLREDNKRPFYYSLDAIRSPLAPLIEYHEGLILRESAAIARSAGRNHARELVLFPVRMVVLSLPVEIIPAVNIRIAKLAECHAGACTDCKFSTAGDYRDRLSNKYSIEKEFYKAVCEPFIKEAIELRNVSGLNKENRDMAIRMLETRLAARANEFCLPFACDESVTLPYSRRVIKVPSIVAGLVKDSLRYES